MDNGPGWLPDTERAEQERYWSGSDWTDRVRPAGRRRSSHVPAHVPQLQRALAAATVDIEAVEERLSRLFERAEGATGPGPTPKAPVVWSPRPALEHGPADADLDEPIELDVEEALVEEADGMPIHLEVSGPAGKAGGEDDGGDDGAFAELDAALVAEEPEQPEASAQPVATGKAKRGILRRRS